MGITQGLLVAGAVALLGGAAVYPVASGMMGSCSIDPATGEKQCDINKEVAQLSVVATDSDTVAATDLASTTEPSIVTASYTDPSSETVTELDDKDKKNDKNYRALRRALGDTMLNKDGKEISPDELTDKKFVALYFSASWCPPCRAFTPSLVDYYKEQGGGENFEVILISSDRDENSHIGYMKNYKMGWWTIPLEQNRKSGLSQKYRVTGIPHMTLIGPDGKTLSSGHAVKVFKDLKKHNESDQG